MPEDIRTDGGAVFIPVETYELKVTINTLDYTGDLIMARLRSSLSTGYQVVDLEFSIDPNDVIVEERIELPFSTANSVNLDSRLQGNDPAKSSNSNANLVRGGSPVFDFNGFSVRERVSKEEFEAYKSKMDSLRKVDRRR